MFVTQMKDDLDGTVYPERRCDSREEAIAYAKLRTAEKQCEIAVRGTDGTDIKFRAGEEIPQAIAA